MAVKNPANRQAAKDCIRCGATRPRWVGGLMCEDCIRETPGTDECKICCEYDEEICGYHSSCYWYCPECGEIRMVGNRPSRPGSGDTVGCYNHPIFDGESHRMIRLTYTSTVEPRLRDYLGGQ